ncbi:MAG: HAMP domain-containing histidine kinase [Christensenellaceae bacterium]|nr:HAMP domain-containing histidine kinase [Christensenellaceae bacterium]
MFGVGGSLLIHTSFRASLNREKDAAYGAHQMVLSTLQIANSTNVHEGYEDISETLIQLTTQNDDLWDALKLGNDEITVFEYGELAFPEINNQLEAGDNIVRYVELKENLHAVLVTGSLRIEGSIMYLQLMHDVSALVEARDIQLTTYRYVFAVMVVLCLALSYLLSIFLTHSLKKLSAATKEIACGTLSARARVKASDEIGELARDFNSMAETLEQNFNELQESVKRQERFTGSFAHEMKTPMTSIIGYADLIRSEQLSSDERIEAANYIVTEGKRLESLSWKLLELLAIKDGKITRSRVHPRDVIAELIERMKPVYSAQGIELRYDCDAGIFSLDTDLIKALLINLMDNARKAISGDGYIRITSVVVKRTCVIKVIDNGHGIPKDALSHLTEAFYRVDKSRSRKAGGVGLGLALCAEIALVHNGTIHFESKVGCGTTVTISMKEEQL